MLVGHESFANEFTLTSEWSIEEGETFHSYREITPKRKQRNLTRQRQPLKVTIEAMCSSRHVHSTTVVTSDEHVQLAKKPPASDTYLQAKSTRNASCERTE